MKIQFESKQARVSYEPAGDTFVMQADRMHLASVLYNLLDNALKYSLQEARIRIKLFRETENIILEVADNGIGIPAVYKERIFEKFFRVPAGDTHNVKGHGLGLSYVASVIRKHGGNIEVESREGEGARFTIRFNNRNKKPGHTVNS